MTYDDAIVYLETFINYEKKSGFDYNTVFKLERVKKFLSLCGDPQKQLKVIHVAGTKGKGSTACFIAHILKEEGLRVGLYTSPHLADFRERIRILDPAQVAEERSAFGGMILKNDFVELVESLKPRIDILHGTYPALDNLTFFEILTVLALQYFKNKNVDFVVLETGLGGRLDATNAASALVSVITPISYDHQQLLGHTLAEIAFEKAGIIKSSNARTKDGFCVSVSADQDKPVREILKRRAKAEGAILFRMGKEFSAKALGGDLFCREFFYSGLTGEPLFLKTRMLGVHQMINASLALAACEALSLHGIRIKPESMTRGILKAFWPGRLEVVQTKPFIILDGAHNADSARRLVNFLRKEFKKLRKWLIFGASEDKDVKGMLEQLKSCADKVILTQSTNPRAALPQEISKRYFKNDAIVTQSVEEAISFLQKEIQPDDVAVVTGSLFVVGEARTICRG